MPAGVAAIVEDHRKHPERGRLLDRVNAYHRERLQSELAASSAAAATAPTSFTVPCHSNIPHSSNRFLFVSCTPGGTPIFEGTICVDSEGSRKNVRCRGYLVTVSDENDFAVVVLDIPERGMIPCLCPIAIIDEHTTKAYQKTLKEKGISDGRRVMHCRSMNIVSISSLPACIEDDGVHGHLLLDGPNNVRGRVVDTRMLTCLEAGCLRTGAHAIQTYYTLNRPWCVDTEELANNSRLLLDTPTGIWECSTGKQDVKRLVSMGQFANESRVIFHKTITKAIIALDKARKLPPPTVDDILLQVSVGGDTDALTMGQFLPCKQHRDHPDIRIRCACGFVVDGIPKGKGLLRRLCQRKSKWYVFYNQFNIDLTKLF